MIKTEIFNQINNITSQLISVSLCDEQKFPSDTNGEIYVSGKKDLSIALKNIPYSEIYSILEKENLKLKEENDKLKEDLWKYQKIEIGFWILVVIIILSVLWKFLSPFLLPIFKRAVGIPI